MRQRRGAEQRSEHVRNESSSLLRSGGKSGGGVSTRRRGLAGQRPDNNASQQRRSPRERTAKARGARSIQRRPRRPEHEPHVSNDRALPAPDDQHHPDRLRPWRHVLRCGGGIWAARGRTYPRRGRRTVPGQGCDHVQVRLEHRPRDRRAAPRAQQPPRTYQGGRRRHAQASPDRSHRSPLPAPSRPAGPDRRCRRRHQGPDV